MTEKYHFRSGLSRSCSQKKEHYIWKAIKWVKHLLGTVDEAKYFVALSTDYLIAKGIFGCIEGLIFWRLYFEIFTIYHFRVVTTNQKTNINIS